MSGKREGEIIGLWCVLWEVSSYYKILVEEYRICDLGRVINSIEEEWLYFIFIL